MSILSCQNLTKQYAAGEAKVLAVNNVNLDFQQAKFTAITGASGSGKSTLLHILGGLEFPTEGKVFYQDEDLFKYNDDQLSVLRRRRFGFVFQAYNLVQEMTGLENILLPIMLDKQKADKPYLQNIIDVLGIEHRLNHLPSAMSGGEQQRIAIARAMANKPSIIFADEPTGNLDAHAGKEVLSLMQFLSKELGVTLILVTHDLNIAEQADRVIRLGDGQIIYDSTRQAI